MISTKQMEWLIVTQTQSRFLLHFARPDIPRVKQEIKNIKLNKSKVSFLKGQKNHLIPKEFCITSVLPFKVLHEQVTLLERAKNKYFQFIKSILKSNETLDYKGYNIMNTRNNCQSLKSKTRVIFTPILDLTLSDPSTVLAPMIKAEKNTNQTGQNITIFTADQHLFRVALAVMWTKPNHFQNFMPCICGMHWIMSFVGSIGVLMRNSCLFPWLKSVFRGVKKMLTGKKFPMDIKTLRFAM